MRNLLFHLTFLAAMIACAPIARADTDAQPISVSGPWITLGDVADASGPLAKVRVAPSPDPGQSMKLDPQFVGKIARENGVYFPSNATAPITVARYSSQEVTKAKQAAARAKLPSNNAPPKADFLLAFSKDMKRGDVILADDLVWIAPPKNRLRPTGTPSTKDSVVGKELKRSVRAQQSFRLSDAHTPALIRKGDPVTLTYLKGGLRLTVDGKALMDAAQGAPVRVLNNYSKKTIDAVVSGAGEARVLGR
ncbi:flagellar basal body P-ring formation chaperone FlgA [Hirschia maritima]|uniref:flagellar basal body P-ring formation chaperone FlgA n=1 Tax=Hirschia maritima TaxID=1121961 RepID=UPI000375C3CD|nr:flagellar basal body P-ring formation chaperone FlgA [Hirschia maritima]